MAKLLYQILFFIGDNYDPDRNSTGKDHHSISFGCTVQLFIQLTTVGEKFWIKASVHLKHCQSFNTLLVWDATYLKGSKLDPYTFSSSIAPDHEFAAQSVLLALHYLNSAAHHHALTHTNVSFVTQDFKVFTAIRIGGGVVFLFTLVVQYAVALRLSKKMF